MGFIAHHPIYPLPLPEGHRFPMEKYDLLPKQLIYEGTCDSMDFFMPKKLSTDLAKRVHNASYVERLLQKNISKKEQREIGFPLSDQLIEREFIIAGGTLEGSEIALESGIAMNIAGGTHHAFRDRGEAFCLLNDQAIAAQFLLDKGWAKSILILDLDVHQGNGTAQIFKGNTHVFTFSMHGQKNYPFRKEQSDLDIGLPDGTSDDSYLKIMETKIPSLVQQIQPDFIFYLCGVDVIETDKLGRLALTIEGCKQRDAMVLELCRDMKIPVQCSMGGGYSKDIKIILEAHANTFRLAKEIYN